MLYMPGERVTREEDISYGRVSGDWSDRPVYVIGAGPSLEGFDFSVLDGYTVGANKSAIVADTDTLVSIDWKFQESYWKEINEFKGDAYLVIMAKTKITYVPNATYLMSCREGGLSKDPSLAIGLNSGYAALNIAFLKGAKDIHLLGFDMQLGQKKHFHGGYEWDKSKGASYNSWARRFKFAREDLNAHNVKVTNHVGPQGSGLTPYFPTKPLTDLDPKYPQ